MHPKILYARHSTLLSNPHYTLHHNQFHLTGHKFRGNWLTLDVRATFYRANRPNPMLHAMAERGIPSISGGQDTSTEERGMDGENKQERRPVMTGVR